MHEGPIVWLAISGVVGLIIGVLVTLLFDKRLTYRRRQRAACTASAGEHEDWMAYLDKEVDEVCEARGWGKQIRRSWQVREKPVAESVMDDYEWKFIPDPDKELPDRSNEDYEGTYYIVRFDGDSRGFVLQHETYHVGTFGPHHELATYTEIKPSAGWPPEGWLRDHLLRLVAQYKPNRFCIT
jgi:hypothetical protein